LLGCHSDTWLSDVSSGYVAKHTEPISVAVVVEDQRDSYYRAIGHVLPLIPYGDADIGVIEYTALDYKYVVPLLISRDLRKSGTVKHARVFDSESLGPLLSKHLGRRQTLTQYELILTLTINDFRTWKREYTYGLSLYGSVLWLCGLPINSMKLIGDVEWRLWEQGSGRTLGEGKAKCNGEGILAVYYGVNPRELIQENLRRVIVQVVEGVKQSLEKNDTQYWAMLSKRHIAWRMNIGDKVPPYLKPPVQERLRGSIALTLEPAEARDAGAAVRVDDGPYQRSGTEMSELSPGSHTLSFKPVPGWSEPSPATVTVIAGKSRHVRATYVRREPVLPPLAQRWAVIIGVSEYENAGVGGLKNLRYASRDAEQLYSQLIGSRALWSKENIKLLTDKQATKEAVSIAILDFLKKAQKDDMVVIFFSGHGSPDPARPKNNYFLCYDTDPTKLTVTGFPMWEIDNALERGIIEAKRVVVLADACHSGGFAPEGMKDLSIVSRNVSEGINVFAKRAATRVVTSCEPGELSQEKANWGDGHGAFAYALIKGLKGTADSKFNKNSRGNGDGKIDLDELVHYVRREVGDLTYNGQHVQDAGKLNASIVNLPK